MDNREIKQIVGDTPNMTLEQAVSLTSFIEKYKIRNILELGFGHGVSTSYIAAALSRNGEGSIITIDKVKARQRKPNIETLLNKVGESDRVTIYYEPTSYTWRLMKFLEQEPQPKFDLCYIDGAHNWFVDGFAFYLVNLLLKPGGWIIFDDLDWTYNESPGLKDSEFVKNMPDEERETPQVRKVYELLVKKHPDFCKFKVEGDWAYTQKCNTTENKSSERKIIVEKIIQKEYYGMGHFLEKVVQKVFK
jgi:predicted O-methyltransferase YrrM